ncbi:MAG: hypothetical protein JOY82_23225 [Streptosporangiaceae bacterium]|nr:hypothetical protein [Streptosporangiaceae bacterium]
MRPPRRLPRIPLRQKEATMKTQAGTHGPGETSSQNASGAIGRRALLKGAASLAVALGTVELAGRQASLPRRMALEASTLPDIQFDIGAFLAPVQILNDGGGNVAAQFPPVHTVFVTARLIRTPTIADVLDLRDALATIESAYPFGASGIITLISYGIPYFSRLPGGMTGPLVSSYMPRLASDTSRYALEEAVPGPTDVSPANPGITKQTFNVPVKIENNDLLLTFRSDNSAIISDVLCWLGGTDSLNGQRVRSPRLFKDLATVTSSRAQFVAVSLPRRLAEAHRFPYATEINPDSPMWMGFLDQHAGGSGVPASCTFAGNESAHLTTAQPGDYFDNGAIQHLSHVIEDLAQFYAKPAEPYTERVQYMFRSDPIPSTGNADQFTDGGGPAYLDNVDFGTGDAARNAQGINTFQGRRRMGHLPALQRSSRAADSHPIHMRMDGPGLDDIDVPDGSKQPKLQFTIFVQTAEFFRVMRINQASLDLAHQFGVADHDNGLERFLTATRRQNFLIPPRRHRAFPLAELA